MAVVCGDSWPSTSATWGKLAPPRTISVATVWRKTCAPGCVTLISARCRARRAMCEIATLVAVHTRRGTVKRRADADCAADHAANSRPMLGRLAPQVAEPSPDEICQHGS